MSLRFVAPTPSSVVNCSTGLHPFSQLILRPELCTQTSRQISEAGLFAVYECRCLSPACRVSSGRIAGFRSGVQLS